MFDTAKNDAQLLPSDLAKLLKVSRVTVSLWFNGHANPHRLLAAKVTRLLDAVDGAVKVGDLPVPVDTVRRERGLYIERVIAKQLLKAPAPAPV